MLLDKYPAEISKLALQLLGMEQEILNFSEEVKETELMVDIEIAADATLKNDLQRKVARKTALESNARYQDCVSFLKAIKLDKAKLQIRYELIVNEFTVAKLNIRQSLAKIEIAS